MDSLSSLDLPDSCLDSISYDPLDDAVTLVPCGHSFSKKTADLLISRRDKCPFDRADIESYVIAYKVRELVAERMEAEPETNREPSLEAVAHVREASQFYNTFNYPRAIDACIKAMNLCPNYQKAQVLLESSLLAQGREGSSKTNLDPEDCSCVKVIPSAPPLEEPVTPSAPPLEDIQPASNPVPKRRLFGDKKSAAVSDCATRLGLLKVRDEDAFGCLVFLSYLSAESISEFWLQILLVEQYEISLAEAMSRARSILKLLEQFQFIVYNEKTSTFSLTQKLPEDQQTSPIYEQTFAFFQEFGERCITNPALALQRGKEWILHMERILQHPLADRQVMLSKAKSYSLMGTIYRDCSQGGIYAVESFRLCVALKKQAYGNNPSADLAGSLYDLGQALFKAGDSAASLEHHQQAFEMRCILYGKRPHVEVWESLHSMGSACCKVGRCLDSVKYHGQALEMGRLLPVSLAYSLQQVADNFYGFGLYEEAVEVYKELLQILEEGGAEELIEKKAYCWNQVGNCYYYRWPSDSEDFLGEAMGSYEQALSMYRSIKVKKVRQNIVDTFFNMGCVLYKQNKIAEALASFKEGLLIEEAIATPSDKDAAMERLAFLGEFFPINSFQNLTPLLHQQQGLVLQNFLLNKKTHLNIANFLRDVGSRFYELNSYDLALISFEQALKMYRALSNQSNHINVACTLRAMGIVYRLIDQHEKALEHFRQALAIFYLLYGKDPKSRTFGIITHISATLISLKQYSEAVELRKQALAMCQVLYGSGPNEKIASELQDLGQTISWVNRTEAIRMIEQSLEMYIQVYQNKPHLKIAETLYLLGKYYAVSEDSARAIVFWRQALAMARDPAVYGNNPSELVDWIDKVAFSIMGEGSSSNEKCYKEARSLYFEEYNILSELHKGPHSNRARILRNIGVCYSKLDGNRAGVLWFKQSLDMYRSLYGKDDAHPDIVEILANIQSLGGSDSCVIS